MSYQSASDFFDSAQAKFFAGEINEAYTELRSALEQYQDSGQLWELLGQVGCTKGDIEESLHALEQASLLIPLSGCDQLVLGWCYEKKEKKALAAQIYRHLSTVKDLDNSLLEPLAKALGRANDNEAALRVCREAASRLPESPEPLMGMVYYMRKLRRPVEQILPCLFRSHHLDPEDVETRKILAWFLHGCGRSEEAAQLLSLIPIEEHSCRSCLKGMRNVFSAAEDYENAKRCADMLQTMSLSTE